MKRQIIHVTLPICATIVVAGAWWAGAGDLNPPPGPILPTMKTLIEVEPRIAINATNTPGDAVSLFRITQPGSYYLTGNVLGVSGRNGILIAVSDVTIDLMGYRLLGLLGTRDGITTDAARNNITIRNGSVSNWANSGIELVSGGSGFLIEAVHARNNGINGGSGIVCHNDGVVRFCTATSNFGDGIVTGSATVVESCAAIENGGDGINTSFGSTITNCMASSNGDDGIVASTGTVTNCTARSNGDDGIVGLAGSTVTNCTTRSNGDDGINVFTGGTVTNCTAGFNTGDGIKMSSACRVVGNTCDRNGVGVDGAGIRATGLSNRIEANNVTGNIIGIEVNLAGNIIIKNTASGNTFLHYFIAGGNVSGSTESTTVGAGPWANFSF